MKVRVFPAIYADSVYECIIEFNTRPEIEIAINSIRKQLYATTAVAQPPQRNGRLLYNTNKATTTPHPLD